VDERANAFLEAWVAQGQLLRVLSEGNEGFWPQLQLGKTG